MNMDQESRRPLRIVLWTAAFSLAVSAMFLFFSASTEANAAQQSNFMGGSPEVMGNLASVDVQTMRLRFPAAEAVEHWRGAHPDEAAVQWTIYGGTVNWLDPVQDEQYRMHAQRP